MTITASPFEQFEIIRIIPLKLGAIDLTVTNSTLYMLYAGAIYLTLYKLNIAKGKVVPGR